MGSASEEGTILVTGACGHIGREVCRVLRAAKRQILRVDVDSNPAEHAVSCDLRSKSDVSRVFQARLIRTVIHLAGVLPGSFQADPLTGADVNLSGSLELMRQAVAVGVKRFVFASSRSVYGTSPSCFIGNVHVTPAWNLKFSGALGCT